MVLWVRVVVVVVGEGVVFGWGDGCYGFSYWSYEEGVLRRVKLGVE